MKILVSGDPHIKISTLETGKRFLAFLKESVLKVRPEYLVVLGDLFDTHAVVRVEVLNAWIDFMRSLESSGWMGEVVLMVGNHDKAGPGSDLHALVALERFQYVTIVDKPLWKGGMKFLPYYHTFEEFKAALDSLNGFGTTKHLFCHNTFDGAQYENGFYDPNGFPLESVAEFQTVICGHVHKAQKLANVVYVGSPYDAGFQDAGEVKGLHLYDTDTDVFQRIQTPLPHYRILTYDATEAFLEHFQDEAGSKEDHYKVIVKGDRAAIGMMTTDERFRALKATYKLSLAPEFTADTSRQGSIVQKAVTLDGMVDTYIAEVMNTSLDKTRLADYARKMLND